MACCAVVVFIIGQLYIAFEMAKKKLGLGVADDEVPLGAADWRPGLLGTRVSDRIKPPVGLFLRGRNRRLVAAFALSAGALGVASAAYAMASSTGVGAVADSVSWCRASFGGK